MEVKLFTQMRIGHASFSLKQIVVLALLASLLALPTQVKAASPRACEPGEKPTVTEEVVRGKTFVVSKLLVKARPDQVWQILVDYGNAAHVFPILRECELLENHGTTKIARHVLAPSGVPGTFEYVLEIHECAPNSMEWHRLSGDFHDVDGYWKLEPTEYGRHTMVTYASYVNGGILMPQVLIRHQFHVDMPNALLALKHKAELDNRIAARRADPASAE
jgi:ribosome-associated toxin RatA of RatAB toxin-antitoxin module